MKTSLTKAEMIALDRQFALELTEMFDASEVFAVRARRHDFECSRESAQTQVAALYSTVKVAS